MSIEMKDTNKKNKDWLYIEECIGSIKTEYNEEDINRIERALRRIFDIDFKVMITENTSGTFYGVNVFPVIDHVNKLARAIINDKSSSEEVVSLWQRCPSWYIEIDSSIINDMSKTFSPADVAALMLHEIARIIYSNKNPIILNNLFRYQYMKLTHEMKALFENDKIRKILDLVVIESSMSKTYNYIVENNDDICYNMITSFGYKNDYNKTLDKITKYFGSSCINRTNVEFEKDLSIVIIWAIENIRQLESTKAKLKDSLKSEMLSTDSYIVKQFIQHIYMDFFGGAIDQYRVLLSEQYLDAPKDIIAEMHAMDNLMSLYRTIKESSGSRIFDKKTGKVKKISQLDIDVIAVDADRIETADDKIYLLDRVYNLLEIIDAGLNYIESTNKDDKARVTQSKSTLIDMQKQLFNLRQNIISTRIVDKQYGIFIKYPKGYEH